MEISLSKIIPAPIPEKDIEQSEIWGRDFLIANDEIVLIYADSGKGKTTFINIIFGTRKDFTGDVVLNGKNVKELSLNDYSELHKNSLSIVPQGLQLFPELSLIENVQIKNRIKKFKTDEQIAEMIDALGLNGFEQRKAGRMSFGQRQRVAIIRALCQPFEIILLDEAFSHLDVTNTKIAWDLIKSEASKQNAGIILTSLSKDFNEDLRKIRV